MTHWNYRLAKHTDPTTGEPVFDLREVYYDGTGDARISGWSAAPVMPTGMTAADVIDDLARMLDSAVRPVLDLDELDTRRVLRHRRHRRRRSRPPMVTVHPVTLSDGDG